MIGNFMYYNPTKLYFGPESLDYLKDELKNYGPTVLLVYGGGSIKKNGIYDQVLDILHGAGKVVVEDSGVMSNPTLEKLHAGVRIAREHQADLILAVGGGSVCDYAKAVAASTHFDGDYWDAFFLKQQDPPQGQTILPVGCVLTMAGTGSEMNGGSVITDEEHTFKVGHVFDHRLMPKFSILNPNFTMSVPERQMKAGIYDIMSHLMEQYFSGEDDNTSDYLAEALMRNVVADAYKAVANPHDYEARSNIMWAATWALNTLVKCGKGQDWMVHMFGHSVGSHTHAAHGDTLAAVSMAYYRHIMPYGLSKFRRFAENVWGVSPVGKSDEEIAIEGLEALKAWMTKIGLPLTISQLGATDEMLESIARGVIILDSGYHKLSYDEVVKILKESM